MSTWNEISYPNQSNHVVLGLKRELSSQNGAISAGFFIISINDHPTEAATGGVL